MAGKFHGQRSMVDYSPWDHKELDMTGHGCTQKQVKIIYGTGSYANGWCLECSMKVLLETWWDVLFPEECGVRNQCHAFVHVKLNKIIGIRALILKNLTQNEV